LAGASSDPPRISTFWVAEPLLRAIMEGAGPEREAIRQRLRALPAWMRGKLLFTPALRPHWPDLLAEPVATAGRWDQAWRQVDSDLGPVPQVPVREDAVQEITACIQSAIVPCHPV
jgi:hypothetical protein